MYTHLRFCVYVVTPLGSTMFGNTIYFKKAKSCKLTQWICLLFAPFADRVHAGCFDFSVLHSDKIINTNL